MKKIIAAILLFSMICSTGFVGMAETPRTEKLSYAKELFILDYLDALGGQPGSDIDTEQTISRGEFVNLCIAILDLSVGEGENIFYDVNRESLYFHGVSYFANAGILGIGDDREFRPNDTILYSEGLKILLELAGYGEYAKANGGYPTGYLKSANRFEVGLDKAPDDGLTYGEAVRLMLDVMTMGVYDLRMVGDTEKYYAVSTKETLLSIHRNLYVSRGTMETTPTFSITSNVAEDGTVYIDGTLYELYKNMDVTGLEGNYVEYMYEDQPMTDRLIYAEAMEHGRDIAITSKEYISFQPNSYTLTYYANPSTNNSSSVEIGKHWTVVLNGRVYKGSLSKALEGFSNETRKGTIEIKRSYDDQNAILIIKSYRRYVISSFDSKTQTLYNKFQTSDEIGLSDYQSVIIRKVSGERIGTDALLADTALLIAESEDGVLLDVLMPEGKADATVTSVNYKKKSIQTDQELFELDPTEWKRVQAIIELDARYTLVLDAFGEVAYMSLSKFADDILLGYLAAVSAESSFGLDVNVKMFTQAGEMQTMTFAGRINIDGTVYREDTMVNALYAIPETETVSGFGLSTAISNPTRIRVKKQLVRYRANANNEITYLDTYYVNYQGGETKETSLTKHEKQFRRMEYRSSSNRFGKDILYNPTTTKVFTVPWTDDEGYLLKGQENMGNTDVTTYQLNNQGGKKRETDKMYNLDKNFTDFCAYNIDAYNYDSNNPYADVIVHHDDFVGNAIFGQIMDICQVLGTDGETGHEIKLIGSSGEKTFFVELDSDIAGISVGDIIYGEYYGDCIYGILKVYDCGDRAFEDRMDTGKEYHPNWYMGYSPYENIDIRYRKSNQFSMGSVVKTQGTGLFWKYDMNDTAIAYDEAADLSKVKYTIYDRNIKGEPVVETGSLDKIRSYAEVGNDCSYVVCMSDYNRTVYVFVYNGR